ncbi:putative odorant receptor 92a [Bombus affinis]|uniref:putative odorant receptor 92a n=1 Tax=Bombus affinis TaxID=309941 RepID=UPI0021B7BFA4|nr:putative odorant receptor 92a [Bombus affinis]
MKELPNTSIDYYILPNRIFCSMVGMWPIEEKSSTCSKIFAYIRLILALTAINSVFVPEIMMIVSSWGDITILAGVGCVLTTVGQLLFKMIYLIVRRERSYRLYYEIRSLWNTANDSKEMQSYVELVYWARICTIVFYSSCMCNVITFSVAGVVDYFRFEYNASSTDNNRHLPFVVWYGTDISASPKFEIAFICQILSSMVCATTISGLDASFMTTILHVSAQFRLINTWISNMGIEINCNPNYTRKIKIELMRCIRHHQRMIHVVEEVNNLLTPIIFMQILTSGIEICLSGYAMLDSGTAKADLVKFISYFISMGIQLLLWCWPGEILVRESQDIGHVVYLNVPWYDLPPIYQQHLCLMIVRAQQYCSISALTFQTLSIHTLTAVFNTAASYFTLLRQIQEK